MASSDQNSKLAALRGLEASLEAHRRNGMVQPDDRGRPSYARWTARLPSFRVPWRWNWQSLRWRRIGLVAGGTLGVIVLGVGLLLWRLSSGPIALDLATPWITAAIEQNF